MNTVIKKSSENNEEPHKRHTDTIFRLLKIWRRVCLWRHYSNHSGMSCMWRHLRLQPRFSSDRMIELVCDLWVSSFFVRLLNESVKKNWYSLPLLVIKVKPFAFSVLRIHCALVLAT